MLNKNNALATGAVAMIAEALPTAHFIVIRREPAFAVQSILGARETIQGSRATPVRRQRSGTQRKRDEPIDDVCAQVLYHERRMEEQRRRSIRQRFWVVEYEQFCRAPHAIVARVAREILGVDVDRRPARRAAALGNTNRIKLPADEFERIRATLAQLSSSPASRGAKA